MVFVGPFRFYDFGKPVRDLLYKDYFTQRKFTMSTYSADGVAITSSATKYETAVDAQVKLRNVTADVKVDSYSKFIISTLFEDLAPGLNSLFTFYGHARSGSLEVQSIDEHVRVYASIDPMTANPTLYASGVVTSGMMGNTQVAVGAQASFNALTGSIIYYHAGVSYTQSDLNAVVTMLDKGETVTASYYHIINPLTNTVVGAEVDYFFPSKENLFVFGIQHALDPLTTVKACVDTIGIVDALVQHQWGVNSLITISCTLDSRDIANRTLFGLGLSLKP